MVATKRIGILSSPSCPTVAVFFWAACAAFATLPANAQSAIASNLSEANFQTIVQCLSHGDEIVMVPKLRCVTRKSSTEIAEKENMPLHQGDWNSVCQDKNDPRRLPADIIKRIDAHKDVRPAPTGIRIIGAVFCGSDPDKTALDLAGLDLNYSVALDRSVINGDLNARNLRVKGDFSFENVLILGDLWLNRAHVQGSVYGNKSFIRNLSANDTQIDGTWWHRESIVFWEADIVRANISGDLNLSMSAFSRLWIQSDHIAGTLDLNDSEARCAYHVNSTTVGYLAVSRAGFGIVKAAEHAGQFAADYAWWNRAISRVSKPYTQQMFETPAIKRIADAEEARIRNLTLSQPKDSNPGIRGCESTSSESTSSSVEFYILDSTVQTALCLTSFNWMVPKKDLSDPAHPTSIVVLNGTRINGNLMIDLWDDQNSYVDRLQPEDKDYKTVRKKHRFEAIGVTAGALFYDFDNARPYFTYIDGLNFSRIHKAKQACTGQAGEVLPSTNDVLQWLEKNAAPSSQPFMAFAEAFERAGTSATRLRVRQRTVELCAQTAGWLSFVGRLCPGERFSSDLIAKGEDAGKTKKKAH